MRNLVWIAPLWNWNHSVHKPLICSAAEFESHLYGIETTMPSSSCTFHSPFESHLYGIETIFAGLFKREARVWIAPLWNWNHARTRETRARNGVWIAPLWNWNHRSVIIQHTPFSCLNRTSMELKRIQKVYRRFKSMFESHLYGIETGQLPGWYHRHTTVWIAPLWNWNKCALCLLVT